METDDIRNAGPVNLGSDKEITVLQLANMIRDMTSSDSRLVFNDMPSDDPVRRRPDIRKAAQILGWKPKTTLGAGLKKVIEKYHAAKTADQNMR